MKIVVATIVLFLSGSLLFGQDWARHVDHYQDFRKTVRGTLKHKEKQEWKTVILTDTCGVFRSNDGTQYYAGGIKKNIYFQNNNDTDPVSVNYVKSGTGVLRTISDEGTKYISGKWRNDFLYGDSIVMEASGDVYFCKWRYGKEITKTKREATEAEIAKLNKDVKVFNSRVRISGL